MNRKWATVFVPKAGSVKFRMTRSWEHIQTATGARVTLTPSGQWHVSLVAPPTCFERTTTGALVGIDRGVAQTISTSDGTHSVIPSLTEMEIARFVNLERRLARQAKGSNRHAVTRKALNRLRDRLRNRRTDWIEKTTTSLVFDYDLIALEDLQIKNLVKAPAPKPDPKKAGAFLGNGARAKAGLNRAIHASCWGELVHRITDKASRTAEDHSSTVLLVDPMNTSRTCHECGHTSAENRKSQATFQCVACGHQAHADTNAARNILSRACKTLPPDGRSTDASATKRCSVKQKGAV